MYRKNAKEFPSPDKYSIHGEFVNKNKGKSFGIGHSSYSKTYMP